MKTTALVKRVALVLTSATIICGSVFAPMKVEAKGTAFIKKKVSSVTPTVKSAKRSIRGVSVTVSVPKNKVKKLGNVKRISVRYGSTKNSRKFEAVKAEKVKVTKKGQNQYTFTIMEMDLNRYKNAYITVRFDGKSNWSKLFKVSGKATSKITCTHYYLRCKDCGKTWDSTTSMAEIEKAFSKWGEEQRAVWYASFGPEGPTLEDRLNAKLHLSYETWQNSTTISEPGDAIIIND